jgi:hypothetical protein
VNRGPVYVAPPSTQYRASQPLNFMRLSIPSNWSEVSGGNDGATYAPENGYVQSQDRSAFTHGFQIGVTTRGSGNLQKDTDALIAAFARKQFSAAFVRWLHAERISGRNALRTALSNVSEVTGQRESVSLTTTQLRDGRLVYFIGVSPQNEASAYEDAFRRVLQSVELSDR